MKVTLVQGYKKNGETIKEVKMREKLTIGMEEEALDMCIALGKSRNLISAEICSIAIAAGLTYDDVRSLHPFDYELLKKAYNSFFSKSPTAEAQETANLTQQ